MTSADWGDAEWFDPPPYDEATPGAYEHMLTYLAARTISLPPTLKKFVDSVAEQYDKDGELSRAQYAALVRTFRRLQWDYAPCRRRERERWRWALDDENLRYAIERMCRPHPRRR
jgi:hypothetical protein